MDIQVSTMMIEASVAALSRFLPSMAGSGFPPGDAHFVEEVARQCALLSRYASDRRRQVEKAIHEGRAQGAEQALRIGLERAGIAPAEAIMRAHRFMCDMLSLRGPNANLEIIVWIPLIVQRPQGATCVIVDLLLWITKGGSYTVSLPAAFQNLSVGSKAVLDMTRRILGNPPETFDVAIRVADAEGGIEDPDILGIDGESFHLALAVGIAGYLKHRQSLAVDASKVLRLPFVCTGRLKFGEQIAGFSLFQGAVGSLSCRAMKIQMALAFNAQAGGSLILPGDLQSRTQVEQMGGRVFSPVSWWRWPRYFTKWKIHRLDTNGADALAVSSLRGMLVALNLHPEVLGLPLAITMALLLSVYGIFIGRFYLSSAQVAAIQACACLAFVYTMREVWRLANGHELSFKRSLPTRFQAAGLLAALLALVFSVVFGVVVRPQDIINVSKIKIQVQKEMGSGPLSESLHAEIRRLTPCLQAVLLSDSDRLPISPKDQADLVSVAGLAYAHWAPDGRPSDGLPLLAEDIRAKIQRSKARGNWEGVIAIGEGAVEGLGHAYRVVRESRPDQQAALKQALEEIVPELANGYRQMGRRLEASRTDDILTRLLNP